MTRKLKALGLGLFAAFAMSAVAASSASAEKKMFHSDVEQTVVTGKDTGGEDQTKFIAGGKTITCETTLYEGTTNEKTVSELTITPTYSNCHAEGPFGNVTTHVEMNGCDYKFTLEEGTTNTGGETEHTHGPVHVVCPDEKEITIQVTIPFFEDCIVHIPAQTPTKPTVDYKNQIDGDGNKDVEVTSTVEGIHYTSTGPEGNCGEPGTHHDGKLTGKVTTQGFESTGEGHKHNGNQVDIWVDTA